VQRRNGQPKWVAHHLTAHHPPYQVPEPPPVHPQVTLSAGVTSLTFGTSGNPKAKPDSPSDIAGITLNPIPAGSSVIFQYQGIVAASAAGTNITSTANGTAVVRRRPCRMALVGVHAARMKPSSVMHAGQSGLLDHVLI